MIQDAKIVAELVAEYGLYAILLIVLVLIIHDPDRAEKLNALILKPFFRFFKWGSRQYLASEVGSTSTEFFKRHVNQLLPSSPDVKIKIKWVKSVSDPVLSDDGTLILRITETNDQSRNVLAATQLALPKVVCPTIRPNLEGEFSTAVDLTLLRKLSEKLGRHARPVFQKYFLEPGIGENRRTEELFGELVELDNQGIFVPIFIEELNLLGESLYALGDSTDKTAAINSFLQYLLNLARRDIGEYTVLGHISSEFSVGIVLLAITHKALTKGVAPYIGRINDYLVRGCDSIYLIAFHHKPTFLQRILKSIEGDERVSLVKFNKVDTKISAKKPCDGEINIALLRRNPLLSETTFDEKLLVSGIKEGDVVEGTVIDVSQDLALLDVTGFNGIITRHECSWQRVLTCEDVLSKDYTHQFVIKSINREKNSLILSLRFPDKDPWQSEKLPKVGDVIDVEFFAVIGYQYIGRYEDDIEIYLPFTEVFWIGPHNAEKDDLTGTSQKVIVYEKSEEKRELKGSIRQLDEDPWPQIHKSLPKGTELRTAVIDFSEQSVRVSLPGGLEGYIPNEAMMRGGFEYADYETSLVKGQGLDVVVKKVFLVKRKIRLDLRRNV